MSEWSQVENDRVEDLKRTVDNLGMQIAQLTSVIARMEEKSIGGRVNRVRKDVYGAVSATLDRVDEFGQRTTTMLEDAGLAGMDAIDNAGRQIRSAVYAVDSTISSILDRGDKFADEVTTSLVERGLATMDGIDRGIEYFGSLANGTRKNVEEFTSTTITRVGSFFGRIKNKISEMSASAWTKSADVVYGALDAVDQFGKSAEVLRDKTIQSGMDSADEFGRKVRSAISGSKDVMHKVTVDIGNSMADDVNAVKNKLDIAGGHVRAPLRSIAGLFSRLREDTTRNHIDIVAERISGFYDVGARDQDGKALSYIMGSDFCVRHAREILSRVKNMDDDSKSYIETKLGYKRQEPRSTAATSLAFPSDHRDAMDATKEMCI